MYPNYAYPSVSVTSTSEIDYTTRKNRRLFKRLFKKRSFQKHLKRLFTKPQFIKTTQKLEKFSMICFIGISENSVSSPNSPSDQNKLIELFLVSIGMAQKCFTALIKWVGKIFPKLTDFIIGFLKITHGLLLYMLVLGCV